MFDVPSTVQRALLASYLARTGPSGSGCGTSVICAVSHVGGVQPVADASLRRTRSAPLIGSALVDPTGAWKVDVRGSSVKPAACNCVSVESDRGGQELAVPITN